MDKDKIIKRITELIEFRETLNDESDRGCALLSASFLEAQLADLLKQKLIDDESILKETFSHNGALGTFSSRINFAYLLGLIGKKAHRDLNLIRKIRNEFGHCASKITFETGAIKARCTELYHDATESQLEPRKKFIRVVMGVLAAIDNAYFDLTRIEPQKDLDINQSFVEKSKITSEELMDKFRNGANPIQLFEEILKDFITDENKK